MTPPSPPLRIAFVETGSGRGGSATSLQRIVRAITHDHADRIAPVCFGYGAEGVSLFRSAGLPVQSLVHTMPGFRFLEMRRLLRAGRFHLLHCNNEPYGHVEYILAARSLGLPVTVHIRGSRKLLWLERTLLPLARHCFAVSQTGVEKLLTQARLSDERITLLGDGVLIEDYQGALTERGAVRQELGLQPDDRVILLPATLQPGKGQEVAVKASRLLRERGHELVLLFAGGEHYQTPGFAERLKNEIRDAGLESTVRLLGHRNDMPRLLAAADAVTLPSLLTEGLPCSIMEAMAAGRPVIASRIGGIPEAVDGTVGYLFEPGSAPALAEAMAAWLTRPEEANRKGTAALARARERYDARRIAARLVEAFCSMADVNQASGGSAA